ncbi:T9SS C-terminal target domain-containing protein, partial [Chryseobacterium indologenes]|nr:T9SS C-terminal target domain-containing protein [Chryseobacterium indologenes]
GDELWQKTLGTSADEEARAVIQTTDLGFFVAGNVQNSSKGYGSKDVLITRLDKDGKELSQLIVGGKGLDEVEKMIPTRDGGALLGIYS